MNIFHVLLKLWRLASSVGAVGKPTHDQRDMKPLLGVADGEHNLCIGVEGGLTQTLPVLTSLKTELICPRDKGISGDESWAAAIFICSPNIQQVPDHCVGVEAMQTQSHPCSRDAIAGVQHVSG